MPRVQLPVVTLKRRAWNKGRLVGQKRRLVPKQAWAIRAHLELAGNHRDLALFGVAIDSKLRSYDVVSLRISDLIRDDPVRETVTNWIKSPAMLGCQFMFPSRLHDRPHISTRQYGQ